MKKILITGLPHSGKSTLLQKLLKDISKKQGFITTEIIERGERSGFKIVNANGKEEILASIKFKTPYKVSRYFVSIDNLEKIIPTVSSFSKLDLLYIDEIGEMELFSKDFKSLLKNYLNAENVFIGTISKVYSDEFTKCLLHRSDIKLIEITPENREDSYLYLKKLLSNLLVF